MSLKRVRKSEEEAAQFGFRWGPLDVARYAIFPEGHHALAVETMYDTITIYVSPKGRSIRVYRGGKELK